MKRIFSSIAAAVVIFSTITLPALAAELLIPVGQIIGLQLYDNTVTVAAFDDALGASAREAGLQIGDEILAIDGKPIRSGEDIRTALGTGTESVAVTVQRDGKKHILTVTPQPSPDGSRLGIYLRQGIAGIGTVTWYDPDTGRFGTLGHGVSNARGGLLEMTGGKAFEAEIASVKKGKCGQPGQLKGSAEGGMLCGTLFKNTPQGVFGISPTGWMGQAIPVADYDQVKTGQATIRSTVRGDSPQEYSVEILKIYPEDRPDGRNFLIKVTDSELLEATGGIVQGMSGSPIIQDGKLVGAVTHVLVNDPTRGYGIFIENMLDAAG